MSFLSAYSLELSISQMVRDSASMQTSAFTDLSSHLLFLEKVHLLGGLLRYAFLIILYSYSTLHKSLRLGEETDSYVPHFPR